MVKRDSNYNPMGKSRGVRRTKELGADYDEADAAKLRRAISAAASVGGALRFGYSRDGGAYAVGIYGDGDPYTEFVRPSEDFDLFLDEIVDLFDAIREARLNGEPTLKLPETGQKRRKGSAA